MFRRRDHPSTKHGPAHCRGRRFVDRTSRRRNIFPDSAAGQVSSTEGLGSHLHLSMEISSVGETFSRALSRTMFRRRAALPSRPQPSWRHSRPSRSVPERHWGAPGASQGHPGEARDASRIVRERKKGAQESPEPPRSEQNRSPVAPESGKKAKSLLG